MDGKLVGRCMRPLVYAFVCLESTVKFGFDFEIVPKIFMYRDFPLHFERSYMISNLIFQENKYILLLSQFC